MPTNIADPTSKGLGELYSQWASNYGLTPTSKGLSELLALLAGAAGGQSAQGTTDLAPTNSVAATLARSSVASQTIAIASGTLQLNAVYLTKGMVVNNISFLSGSTAGVTMSNQWGVIASGPASGPIVVAVTANGGAAAIGGNAVITYALTAAYTVPASGIYYVGVMVAAATPPTFAGVAVAAAQSNNIPPIISGTSNTGATTPPALAAVLTTITATVNTTYLWLT